MSHLKPIFLFLFLACVTIAVAQENHITATTTIPDHPRLLLLKGEELAIQKTMKADQTWASAHQAIINEADAIGKTPVLERIVTGRRLLSVSREALRRLFTLGYAYRLTRQPTYLKRGEQELLTVSAFSDWNPSHFLDVAEMTMAVAIGYDWLHSELPESSRAVIRKAILKKGLEPSLLAKNNGWLKATHNWNQVCNAGIAFGALAIYEDQPELARSLINRAITTVKLPMGDYNPTGAYQEGYSYWGYGTSFNVLLISAVEKAFGTDFGLSALPGFMKTASFMENMTGPTGIPFNYSDSGGNSELQPAMFWFANRLNEYSLLLEERRQLTNVPMTKHVKNRIFPAVMIWGSGVSLSKIDPPREQLWVGTGRNPVAMMRSSWTDPAAIYVGVKTGSPSVNHGHMDVGSFVMDADGVRWAMDLGMEEYNPLEVNGVKLWGMTQDSERWTVFRYNNFVHNTLTINGQLQQVKGFSSITSSSDKPQFMNVTTDLTSIYSDQLAKANRGIAIINKSQVVVRDELETGEKEATVRWTMATPATVTILGNNRVELTKDGKKLILQVQEPANVTMKTWPTMPSRTYENQNKGTTLLGFEVVLPAKSKSAITVVLMPEKGGQVSSTPVLPLAQWPK
ncbi:heparinase II/III domain-containing protein [Fibrella aquatica]|uniref:heparinase II/III domain-containing protein n=1 Tax=Fibrella aquatica TaxID=3242487 RepID=UPI003520219C